MRAVILIAGAGGMYCGSCLRDNRLAARLRADGRDVVLVPLYTPIRTDENDVSTATVYYGGLGVYLQQRGGAWGRALGALGGVLDRPWLLRMLGRFAGRTRPETLGALTVSVLRGPSGTLRPHLERLIDGLKRLEPSVVHLPNLMFVGMAGELRRRLEVPVVCSLSGEDIFLDALLEPHRGQALELIARGAADVELFLAPTRYYAGHAAVHFGLPTDRIEFVPLGVSVDDLPPREEPPKPPFVVAYMGRICPEKGLAELTNALLLLRDAGRDVRVRAAGYLSPAERPYLQQVEATLVARSARAAFEYLGEVSREQKLALLASAHVLCVPATYREAKGLYVLESLASGVPVVQPRHGSFPELVEETGGGILYDATGPAALADALSAMMDADAARTEYGRRGQAAVREQFSDRAMATQTWAQYTRLVGGEGMSRGASL